MLQSSPESVHLKRTGTKFMPCCEGSHKLDSQPRRRFFMDENKKLVFDKSQMDEFNMQSFVPLEVKVNLGPRPRSA